MVRRGLSAGDGDHTPCNSIRCSSSAMAVFLRKTTPLDGLARSGSDGIFYTIQAAEMGGKKSGPMMELLAGAIIPLDGGGTKFPPQQSDAAPDACSHLPPLCRLTALE